MIENEGDRRNIIGSREYGSCTDEDRYRKIGSPVEAELPKYFILFIADVYF